MRGRKPLPTNLKLIKGVRPERINEDEPVLPIKIPDAPEYLSDEERDVFVSMAGKLVRMRVMTEADTDAIAIYSVNFVRWRDATGRLRETGPLMRSPNGYPIQSPYLAVANKAQSEMMKILVEFGLTPSSRSRVKAT